MLLRRSCSDCSVRRSVCVPLRASACASACLCVPLCQRAASSVSVGTQCRRRTAVCNCSTWCTDVFYELCERQCNETRCQHRATRAAWLASVLQAASLDCVKTGKRKAQQRRKSLLSRLTRWRFDDTGGSLVFIFAAGRGEFAGLGRRGLRAGRQAARQSLCLQLAPSCLKNGPCARSLGQMGLP